MANLVDDFKNLVSNGVRIRDGVVNVPNSSSPIAPLDLYEIVICENETIVDEDSSRLYFSSNATQEFIVFSIPMGVAISTITGTPSVNNYKSNNYYRMPNRNFASLYPFVYTAKGGATELVTDMRWLVLRIA